MCFPLFVGFKRRYFSDLLPNDHTRSNLVKLESNSIRASIYQKESFNKYRLLTTVTIERGGGGDADGVMTIMVGDRRQGICVPKLVNRLATIIRP